jgi:hypothetical protein
MSLKTTRSPRRTGKARTHTTSLTRRLRRRPCRSRGEGLIALALAIAPRLAPPDWHCARPRCFEETAAGPSRELIIQSNQQEEGHQNTQVQSQIT